METVQMHLITFTEIVMGGAGVAALALEAELAALGLLLVSFLLMTFGG